MDTEKNKRDNIFITIVVLGTLGVVVGNILSSDYHFYLLLGEAATFILTMYAIFYPIPKISNKIKKRHHAWGWRKYPEIITSSLKLLDDNKINLRIRNDNSSEKVYVRCSVIGLFTPSGNHYNNEYSRNELKLTYSSSRNSNMLFEDYLAPLEVVVTEVGHLHKQKVTLRMGWDVWHHGWRDGKFEYRIHISGRFMKEHFSMPNKGYWIVIEDGKVVEVKEK